MVLILAYHSVSDKEYKYAVTPEEFRWQIETLKRKFDIINLPKLEEIINGKVYDKKNYAVITFDDGLEDNYTNAFPILKELNISVTIFLTTGLVNKDITNKSGFQFHFLNWIQIREMHESGFIDFQAHTHNHPDLTKLDDKAIVNEFRESKGVLREELNKEVKYFAYPKGLYNERVKKIAVNDYELAFGESGVVLNLRKADQHLLPRITVSKKISKFKFLLMQYRFLWQIRNFIKRKL